MKLVLAGLSCLAIANGCARLGAQCPDAESTRLDAACSSVPLRGGYFVPNRGQWTHAAAFVQSCGPTTLFLLPRGWVLDATASARGRGRDRVALRMTFEGHARVPRIVGERRLPGHHHYLLGRDPDRWRTGVPLFGAVRYDELYPGIDLRIRDGGGVPEYDLLLEANADLSSVVVHVEGAVSMAIARDGSLVIETELGSLTQPAPTTWQVDGRGRKRPVQCRFTLLGPARFGFAVAGWVPGTRLTIDPGLIWSTFLGGAGFIDTVFGVSVDARGVATVAGATNSSNLPTTVGAYERKHKGKLDVYVSALDPTRSGQAQLVYSTFLGGKDNDSVAGLAVTNGVVTLVGSTSSADFPTTAGAFDRRFGAGGSDVFVARLDPSRAGKAQLVYSTFLGGGSSDVARGLAVGNGGVVNVAGDSSSTDLPTTAGAFSRAPRATDAFVARVDPGKSGSAQLVYSTFLGSKGHDGGYALAVDRQGVITVTGQATASDFPTTAGAYDRTHNGSDDVFVSRLDPRNRGAAQLVFSTLLGGSATETPWAIAVDEKGVVTLAGHGLSADFPTSSSGYDRTHNGNHDAFISRLDPRKSGAAQLLYSTYFGGSGHDYARAMTVDGAAVTIAGTTQSNNLPATGRGADVTFNGSNDAFVTRLRPALAGPAQLDYSTFVGGKRSDQAVALAVDRGGVATIGGTTGSLFSFPTTPGAFDRTHNGGFNDGFVSRVSMGLTLWADRHELSLRQGGAQRLTLDAGKQHANKTYLLLGTLSGTSPGVKLTSGITLPLNPDAYFTITLLAPNSPLLGSTLGRLNAEGSATAAWNAIPQLPQPPAGGFRFHHAFVVIGTSPFELASNAVPLTLLR